MCSDSRVGSCVATRELVSIGSCVVTRELARV